MGWFDGIEDVYDAIEYRVENSFGGDAPPPPPADAPGVTPESLAAAERAWARGRAPLSERIAGTAEERTGIVGTVGRAFQGLSDASGAVKWMGIALVVVLGFIAILVIFGTAAFLFNGTYSASKAFFDSGGLDLLNPAAA